MNKNTGVLSKNRNGELIYNGLNDHISQKYKPDTPLDNAVVPYVIMLFCAIVDTACFISLFKMISYDSMFMLGIQVAGLLFAFDIVPIFLGVQHKRIKQNLTNDRIVLYLALGVCATALIINIVLNVMTIDLMNPDVSSMTTNYFGTTTEQAKSESFDPSVVALTIFRIGCPVLTSIGSYFISFLTYDPLKTRKRILEEALCEKGDEIRRLAAVLDEYDADIDFAENLRADDEEKFEAMENIYRAKVNSYGKFVEQLLKENLGDAKSTSALSEQGCKAFIENFDNELETFKKSTISERGSKKEDVKNNIISNYIAV